MGCRYSYNYYRLQWPSFDKISISCRPAANLLFFAQSPRGGTMSILTTLVQAGPTGAGLAFSLLGYWLLRTESKKSKERIEMHTSIRIFIVLSALTFALGIF